MPGKRVQFDNETWASLDLLAKDQMKSFPELADEAFRDLLRKHGRPVDLKDALRRSAGKRRPSTNYNRRKEISEKASKHQAACVHAGSAS
jgi:hypothetical protein